MANAAAAPEIAADVRRGLEDGSLRRVLLVRASRLGDLLMTTPTIRALRQAYPDVELSLLTNPYSAELVRHNPDLDDVVAFDGRERDLTSARGQRFARGLAGRYDVLIALRPRKELERFAHAAEIVHVFPRGNQSEDRERHVVQQCFDRIAPLGLHGEPGPLVLELEATEIEAARTSLRLPERFLHVHPGCDETTRWKLRRGVRRRIWPTDHWIELLDRVGARLDLPVVMTSGSEIEGRWNERIARASNADIVRAHRVSLRHLAALTQCADACVTVDTGPLHLATAVSTPLVGLYGPSPVEFTGPWAPTARRHTRVLRRDLPCMPCQGRGVHCPRNVCMEEIDVAQVLEALEAILEAQAL